jgi:hypothetical protein
MKIRLIGKTQTQIVLGIVATMVFGVVGVMASGHGGSVWQDATRLFVGPKVAKATAKKSGSVTSMVAVRPTPTPTPTSAATTSSSKSPTPTPRFLDFKDGACEGIHASDDGCVVKDTSSLRIASLTMWPKNVTCSGTDVNVSFDTLFITRHYLSGSGGTAQVRIDYSDGASSPVSSQFTTSTDVKTIDGISHTFANTNAYDATYQVVLVSPDQTGTPVGQGWGKIVNGSIQPGGCAPTPTPTPYYQWSPPPSPTFTPAP